jgi:hypothetical protein
MELSGFRQGAIIWFSTMVPSCFRIGVEFPALRRRHVRGTLLRFRKTYPACEGLLLHLETIAKLLKLLVVVLSVSSKCALKSFPAHSLAEPVHENRVGGVDGLPIDALGNYCLARKR